MTKPLTDDMSMTKHAICYDLLVSSLATCKLAIQSKFLSCLNGLTAILLTVSESCAIRRCDMVSPAALKARSLGALDAEIDRTRQAIFRQVWYGASLHADTTSCIHLRDSHLFMHWTTTNCSIIIIIIIIILLYTRHVKTHTRT